MAEFVQKCIEEMLPELEQMERVQLFTSEETRKILKRRKVLEYKLRRKTKQKDDFLQYIQYEIHTLSLLKKRRERMRYFFKKLEIDVAITNRIHKLYKMACNRFKDDVKLWLSHIDFCKRRKEKAPVGNLFTSLLQIHSDKPQLWVLAAKWEMEDALSMDNARGLLQRGLRFNPKSQLLWREYFRMELLYVEKIVRRMKVLGVTGMEMDEKVPDVILEGAVAKVIFDRAMNTIPDNVEFCLSFLPVCRLFDFTQELNNYIFQMLEERYFNHALYWKAKAIHQLEETSKVEKGSLSKKDKVMRTLTCEDQAVKVFKQGIQKLNTESIWSLYVEFCVERLQRKASRQIVQLRTERALNAFQEASDSNKLSEKLYSTWVEVLLKSSQVHQVESALTEGTTRYPKSVELWVARLQHAMYTVNDINTTKSLLDKALNTVKEKESWPLWQLGLEWSMLHCREHLKTLLETGIQKCAEVCVPMKEAYLDVINEDIHTVREIYARLSVSQPLSVSFFKKYINIENCQPKPKMKILRKAYEDALREFGTNDPDLWLDYIRLETTHPRGKPENVGTFHWRAIKTLDGSLTERFINAYTLLQNDKLPSTDVST